MNGFCYLEGNLNESGGCEVADAARVRTGCVRFRECGEWFHGNSVVQYDAFSLRLQAMICRAK